MSNFFRNLFGGSESQPSTPRAAAGGGHGSNASQDPHSSVNVVSESTISADASSRHSPTIHGATRREQVQQCDEVASEGSSNDSLVRVYPEHSSGETHGDDATNGEAGRIAEQEQQVASRDRLADRVNRDFNERWQRLRREREEDDTV